MTEQLYASRNNELPKQDNLWSRALLELNIPGYTPKQDDSYSQSCNYNNALSTLRNIRQQHSIPATYQVIWAQNQDKVFSACDSRQPANSIPPEVPTGKGLPKRAQSDYLYQLGSWNFYKGKFDEALKIYKKVEKTRAAPQRLNAAYMVVRTLANLHEFDAAYEKIGSILGDPSLQDVHAIAGNYRFVIMSNSNYLTGNGERSVSPELAIKHLRWLHDLIRIDPDKTADAAQAIADYKDAKEQLASYFPLYDKNSFAVDWWLTESSSDSLAGAPRMNAVKTLAPELKLIDWMQSVWAYNIFSQDWLWALHDTENAYWLQNGNIVSHAWGRWQTEHDGVWLDIAMQRVHPSSPLANDILNAAQPWLARPWDVKTLAHATPEYRAWLYSIWENGIRINLGAENPQGAIELIARQPNVRDLFSYQDRTYFDRRSYPEMALEKAIRWLVYTGDVENARIALAAMQTNQKYVPRKWVSLLATSISQADIGGASSKNTYSWQEVYANDPAIWQAMVDEVSAETLYVMASNTEIALPYRALISRTALSRALLLHYDNDAVDKYSALAAKLNPYLREQILTGVARHEEGDYVNFFLKMPRFRPMAFLEYSTEIDEYTGDLKKESLSVDAIDRYNHNDNNWWCRFDSEQAHDRVWTRAKITPNASELFTSKKIEEEVVPYLKKQRELLAQHPYRTLVNQNEIAALETIPSGPQYLSQAVSVREKANPAATTPDERSARAANLHRAVRTTRYSCNRNGPHGEYSETAFKLLHSRYGDTPWAKATPYWFN